MNRPLAYPEGGFFYNTPSHASISILRAFLDLAQALDLETIAEGVETKEMEEALLNIGFTQAQGYFYGKPMTAAKALEFIQSGQQVTH
ncbi:EAL domain-containing protein [Marinomonas sp. IMCC 4694]|uniref:EAL domain-containing protein n=1 Tax=Marinomonas sp. IMCC 4694 TaxID=2605432 RepID=UPI0011E81011|nr:EAL domain-containing protein [Marinomonas sp. IMCC 4694]TYL46599.1 EAL domain-containing protein [Marinomonas sp. IMCC 4694]